MQWMIFQVDAFTSTAFAGNPAAVYLLAAPREDAWLQRVASEMNLSETAFLTRARGVFDLRWFTPTVEVELCGHATLASAHILWEEGYLQPDEIARFQTRSGLLTARRDGDWIELDFPADPVEPAELLPGLLSALGLAPQDILFTGLGKFDYLVELASPDLVRSLQPDFVRLAAIPARGIVVTSRTQGGEYDFISRFFGPRVGVNEDPVTGSAHCSLAPYWAARLGKEILTGYQASARGGVVRVHPVGDRVLLAGQAITISHGVFVA